MAHPTDEGLEQYALGRLAEFDTAPLEEHLLLCSDCQSRLQEMDEYVEAMRKALAEMEAETRLARPKTVPNVFNIGKILRSATAAAALAAAAMVVIALPIWRGDTEPVDLRLEAFRGAEQSLMPAAPAGQPLRLTVDLTGLPPSPEFVVELVDSSGGNVWEGVVRANGAEATAEMGKALATGQYWTRIYEQAPSGLERGELLREFGLRLE